MDASRAVAIEYEVGDCSFHHGRTLHYTGPNHTDQPRRGLSTHFGRVHLLSTDHSNKPLAFSDTHQYRNGGIT